MGIRLLMGQEKTFKVRANHYILPVNKLCKKGNGTSWIWSAKDFAEGSHKSELFCIRFGKKETVHLGYGQPKILLRVRISRNYFVFVLEQRKRYILDMVSQRFC